MKAPRATRCGWLVAIDLAGLFALYALSRALAWHAGVTFDLKSLQTSWQLLDPALLRHHLLASVAHMPGQPPLFNLVIGALLKIGDTAGLSAIGLAALFRGFYSVLALAAVALTYDLFRSAGCSRLVSVAVTAVFACSPAFLLYESAPYYTLLVLVWLLVAARCLIACAQRPSAWRASAFFLAMAGLIATRSLFQIEWFVVLGLLLLLAGRGARKTIALAALVPLALVLLIYAKNVVLVGQFSTSDWLGLSLAKLTTLALPHEKRVALVESGRLSPEALDDAAYDLRPADIPRLGGPVHTGSPVLDNVRKQDGSVNYNALLFARRSQVATRDALAAIRAAPAIYAGQVATAWLMFFRPASDYPLMASNRAAIASWCRLYAHWVAGQPVYPAQPSFKLQPGTVGRFVVLGYLLALAYGVAVVVRCVRRGQIDSRDALLLFCWLNALYVGVVGNALEIDENQRFRFAIEPFVAVLDVVALRAALALLLVRVRRLRGRSTG